MYPDVVGRNPSSGEVDVIEEVETRSIVHVSEVAQWHEFATLGVPVFNLVVPRAPAERAVRLVDSHAVGATAIITYSGSPDDPRFHVFP